MTYQPWLEWQIFVVFLWNVTRHALTSISAEITYPSHHITVMHDSHRNWIIKLYGKNLKIIVGYALNWSKILRIKFWFTSVQGHRTIRNFCIKIHVSWQELTRIFKLGFWLAINQYTIFMRSSHTYCHQAAYDTQLLTAFSVTQDIGHMTNQFMNTVMATPKHNCSDFDEILISHFLIICHLNGKSGYGDECMNYVSPKMEIEVL